MVIGTNLGYLRPYFLKKNKYIAAKGIQWSSAYCLCKIFKPLQYSWSDKALPSLKRILNVDLSYLPEVSYLSVQNCLINFRK